ncbi:MAG TPA: hypothetical protein VF796_17245, partial [Humisphaera sp.]
RHDVYVTRDGRERGVGYLDFQPSGITASAFASRPEVMTIIGAGLAGDTLTVVVDHAGALVAHSARVADNAGRPLDPARVVVLFPADETRGWAVAGVDVDVGGGTVTVRQRPDAGGDVRRTRFDVTRPAPGGRATVVR